MSDARRKRRQERVGKAEAATPTKSRTWVWIVALVVVALAYTAYWYHTNHRYDDFARCMASKQVKMYGAYWCPHCADQKEILGKSYRFVYVECGVPDSHAESDACTALGVKMFPTWRFPDGSMTPLVFSAQELSDKTGCSLP